MIYALTLLSITLVIALVWAARVALRLNASAKEGWAQAAKHQQQAGELAPDALRWRLHIKDCARGGRTAAQRQQAPVRAMTARLRGEAANG